MSVATSGLDLTIEHSLRGKPSMFQPPGLDGWAINFEHYWSGPHCPYHYHPEFELAMTRGTRGKRVVGNVVVPYTGTELCLIGSNLPHTMVADRGPMGKVRPEIAVVHFTRESLGMELLARPELVPVNALLRRAAHAVKFVDRGARPSAAAELMDEVVRAEGDRFRQFLAFLALLGSLANRTDGRTLLADNYSATLAGVLSDGVVDDAERAFLERYRAVHEVGDAQHRAALAQLGWSERHFRNGRKGVPVC